MAIVFVRLLSVFQLSSTSNLSVRLYLASDDYIPINWPFRALFLYPFLTSCEELYTEFVVLLTTLLIFNIAKKMTVRKMGSVQMAKNDPKWPLLKMQGVQNDQYLIDHYVRSLNIITKSIGFRFFNR